MNPLNRRIIDQWHRVALSGDRTARDAMFRDDAVFESPVVHTPRRGKTITTKYLAGAALTFANSGANMSANGRATIRSSRKMGEMPATLP